MRLRKEVDSLRATVNARFDSIEDALKILVARGEAIGVLEAEIKNLRIEKRQLLDRVMARDFESYRTYTAEGGEETIGKELRQEEDPDMAGEVLSMVKEGC